MILTDELLLYHNPQKRSASKRMTVRLPPTTTSEVVEMIKSWFTAGEAAAALAALLHLHNDDNQSKPTHEGIFTT